jgi:FMN phosphatase YigB (HAD superfamily)
MNLQNVKNIIFDLGGVILDIDPNKTVKAFASHLYKKPETELRQLYTKIVEGVHLIDYEKGKTSDAEFRSQLCHKLDVNLSDDQFDKAFNAMLLDYTDERISLLQDLGKKFNLYLLSNTCHIHYLWYNNLLQANYDVEELSVLFKKTYLSFEMGMRKPDLKIYQTVLNDAGLVAEETVFIDDSLQNVKAAEAVGIKGIHKPATTDLVTLF